MSMLTPSLRPAWAAAALTLAFGCAEARPENSPPDHGWQVTRVEQRVNGRDVAITREWKDGKERYTLDLDGKTRHLDDLAAVNAALAEAGLPRVEGELPTMAAAPGPAAEKARGWLGLGLQPVPEALRAHLTLPLEGGAFVARVAPGSPADRAGLTVDDVVLSISGPGLARTPVDPERLSELVRGRAPGTRVALEVLHQGQSRSVDVTLGEAPNDPPALGFRQPPPGDDALPWPAGVEEMFRAMREQMGGPAGDDADPAPATPPGHGRRI